MYKNKSTGQWLKEKSDIEQQHIINDGKNENKEGKTTALKQQINMCREIVQVPSKDKYIFQFSKKGKQFDIQQLKENLLKLIEKSNVDNNQLDQTDQLIKSIKDNPRNVIGRHLEHEWSDKKWKGRVIALQDNEFEVNIRHLTVHITHCSGTLLQNLFCQYKHLSDANILKNFPSF